MGKRQYPYIFQRYKLKPGLQHDCSLCKELALYLCEIQVNWFRGDDESEFRCEAHSRNAIDQSIRERRG